MEERNNKEYEFRKVVAGFIVLAVLAIVFHIPGLFNSFDKQIMSDVKVGIFLILLLLTSKNIIVNSIKMLFTKLHFGTHLVATIITLGLFAIGWYEIGCLLMFVYQIIYWYLCYNSEVYRD